MSYQIVGLFSFKWALTLLVCAASPLFFLGGPDWVSPDLVRKLWDFGHIIFFAVLTLLILHYVPMPRWQHWLVFSLVIFLVGGTIELIQGVTGRNQSWSDVLSNLAGAWLALFWSQKKSLGVGLGRVLALVALSPALWKLMMAASASWAMYTQFPMLNSFETRAELHQLHFSNTVVKIAQSNKYPLDGRHSLAVTLQPARYSGMRMSLPVSDWSGYRQLSMGFFNPAQMPLVLTLRISDRQHDRGQNLYDDRFNVSLTLTPGWNRFVFSLDDIAGAPAQRSMDMQAVSSLGIFASHLSQASEFYWDAVQLE